MFDTSSQLRRMLFAVNKARKTGLAKSNLTWPGLNEPLDLVVKAAVPACDRRPAWLHIKPLKRCNYRSSAGWLYERETCHCEKPFKWLSNSTIVSCVALPPTAGGKAQAGMRLWQGVTVWLCNLRLLSSHYKNSLTLFLVFFCFYPHPAVHSPLTRCGSLSQRIFWKTKGHQQTVTSPLEGHRISIYGTQCKRKDT